MRTELSSEIELVSFMVSERLYGFHIHLVKEINPDTRLVPVPLCSNSVRGLVNIRGEVVMALDIAVLLGLPPRPITCDSHLIIMKTCQEITDLIKKGITIDSNGVGDNPIAFLVDQVGEVMKFKAEDMKTQLPPLKENHSRFVNGVASIGENLLLYLDPVEMIKFE